jgi:hypothetical protein
MFFILRKPNGVPWTTIAALTTAVFGATAGLEWAAEPASRPSQKQLSYRDIQLTVHARKALADDPAVGPDNLGVEGAGRRSCQESQRSLRGPRRRRLHRRAAPRGRNRGAANPNDRGADAYGIGFA